jgi:hypothetical protein
MKSYSYAPRRQKTGSNFFTDAITSSESHRTNRQRENSHMAQFLLSSFIILCKEKVGETWVITVIGNSGLQATEMRINTRTVCGTFHVVITMYVCF